MIASPATMPALRVAFVGQATFFEACSLEPEAGAAAGLEPRFFEYRQGADAERLLAALEAFDPDFVIAFRPEILPAGLLHDLRGAVIGFLTEPLPRSGSGAARHEDLDRRLWELGQVDPLNVDRVVAFDPLIARTADAVLPVWRSLPLPVADRFYAPAPAQPASEPRVLFVGRSTPHREKLLGEAKARGEVLHLAFGVAAAHLEELLHSHDVAINIHNHPYPSFENRVCLHLAAANLVVSEPLSPLHGLEPGIDHLVFSSPGELADIVTMLGRFPGIWHDVRVRGRQKAELFRASRVYPRLVGDLLLDLRTRPSRRPGAARRAAAA
jgi:hypothetical protein